MANAEITKTKVTKTVEVEENVLNLQLTAEEAGLVHDVLLSVTQRGHNGKVIQGVTDLMSYHVNCPWPWRLNDNEIELDETPYTEEEIAKILR
jgi:hypothetical protein